MAAAVTGGTGPQRADATATATPGVIRVGVVDDHPVVREGTSALLAAQPGIEIVGTADDLASARALADGGAVDVLLLDVRLGSTSGLHLLTDPGRQWPAVIVLTAHDYPQYAQAARDHGAAGFVPKTAPLAELMEAIRRAAAGERSFPVATRTGVLARLSPRELEITRLVAEGRTNDEIAGALAIGTKTVETHLARLFERFQLASRTELATRALRDGWLDIPAG